MYLNVTCLGGYRERETPGPIPNPEAKPLIADNTRPFRAGNVGRCLVVIYQSHSLFNLLRVTNKLTYLMYASFITALIKLKIVCALFNDGSHL